MLGPTAVGKSELAVALAERIDGEIVGADAYQIYAGFDILSAKPSAELRARVPHHLIGEIPLTEAFDVVQFRGLALARAREIAARGRIPIVCGGAGLYARALTHGLAETPPSDPALRANLQEQPLEELVTRLRALDPATTVDEKNPRRVIRALEVCILTGRPFSSFREEWEKESAVRGVILTRSRESLNSRIAQRTAAMFREGVVEEVAAAGEIGPTAAQMLGLREIRALLAGKISREECEARVAQATRQYAKRQLTWFRRERGYVWIDLDAEGDPLSAMEQITSGM